MAYSEATIEQVWSKGRVIPDHDPREWRMDVCGAWMRRAQYGSRDTDFGWTIENTGLDGEAGLDLRPFHVRNTYDVASHAPHCRVTADRIGQVSGELIEPPRNRVRGEA